MADTVETFRLLSKNAGFYFGDNAAELSEAIDEYIRDFIDDTDRIERVHPGDLILKTDRVALQSAGFYGAQLNLKERQVTSANQNLREAISADVRRAFTTPFKKWVGIINNFIGSLEVTGQTRYEARDSSA